jgi:hypothetical protein
MRSGRPAADVGQQRGQRARGHALDARGLAERQRAHCGKLFTNLVRKPADGGIVQFARQSQVLIAAEGLGVGGLAVEGRW